MENIAAERSDERPNQEPLRITDGVIYHSRDPNDPLNFPYRQITEFDLSEQTNQLVKWLKRPTIPNSEKQPFSVPDPAGDVKLKAVKSKISKMFGGTRICEDSPKGKKTEDLLSPLTTSFLCDMQQLEEQNDLKRISENVAVDLSTRRNKLQVIKEKKSAVQDYIRWLEKQINVSNAVHEQTIRRTERDQKDCDAANQHRMECTKEQKSFVEERLKLRAMWKARKDWRAFMTLFLTSLGKTFYDIADFCGFYEINAAVLKLCTDMQESGKIQLGTIQKEAEIRLEEWETEKMALKKRLQKRLATRNDLSNEIIELQDLNRVHRNLHDQDKKEQEKLVECVDDLIYAIRSLTDDKRTSQSEDNLQRLWAFERFLILSEKVEKKMTRILGSELDYDAVFSDKSH